MGVSTGFCADKEEGGGSSLEDREGSVELVTESLRSPASE